MRADSEPEAKIQRLESNAPIPKSEVPISEKNPLATQPTDPNARSRGKDASEECAIAIADDIDHVGM